MKIKLKTQQHNNINVDPISNSNTWWYCFFPKINWLDLRLCFDFTSNNNYSF